MVKGDENGFLPEGDWEFASRIMQKFNILSLVAHDFSVDKDNFWSSPIYKQLVWNAFWTFSDFFLLKLKAKIKGFSYDEALMLYKELDRNFYPYRSNPTMRGGELEWAIVKNCPLAAEIRF